MKRSKIQYTAIFGIFLMSIMFITQSCKKEDEDFIGPSLGVASSNFAITGAFTASSTNVNFMTQTVDFTATFNENVTWTIRIVGDQSGAVKSITGTSTEILAGDARWDGSTDTVRLFRQGETATAILTVFGSDQSFNTTITIVDEKDHGHLLSSFEGISINQGSDNFNGGLPNSYWWFFSFESGEETLVDTVMDGTSPHGTSHILLSGVDINSSYYIGKVGLSPSGATFNFGTTNPDSCYFNFYLKGEGTGADKDHKFVIETWEDDAGDGLQYNASEDKYAYQVSLQYDGWKLFSIPYSSFSLDAGVTGPYQSHSPDKVANMGYFIGANTSSGLSATIPIEAFIDLCTVTVNGPMIP